MSDDPIDVREMIAAYRAVARPSRAVKRRIVAALDAPSVPPVRWWPVAVLALAAAALFVVARGGWAGALFERTRVEREPPEAPYDNGAERSAAPVDPRAPVPDASIDSFPPSIEAPVVPADEAVLAPSSTGEPARAQPARVPARAAPRPAHEPAPAPRTDDVVAEMALLERARVHVRSDRGADALAIVEQHAHEFPRGHLGEERDALRVLASCMLTDRRASALALKREFLLRYPRSTYVERVRAACPTGGADQE